MNRSTAAAALLVFFLSGCGALEDETPLDLQGETSEIAAAPEATADVDPATLSSPSISSFEAEVARSAGAITGPSTEGALADTCGASKVKPWIGEDSTVPVRRAVAQAADATSDRWIHPDSIVTQDRLTDRLTVVIEQDTNIILRAFCG